MSVFFFFFHFFSPIRYRYIVVKFCTYFQVEAMYTDFNITFMSEESCLSIVHNTVQ